MDRCYSFFGPSKESVSALECLPVFSSNPIVYLGAALTIPSALAMITTMFPSHGEQDRALGM